MGEAVRHTRRVARAALALDTTADIRAAWGAFQQKETLANYRPEELSSIRERIRRAAAARGMNLRLEY